MATKEELDLRARELAALERANDLKERELAKPTHIPDVADDQMERGIHARRVRWDQAYASGARAKGQLQYLALNVISVHPGYFLLAECKPTKSGELLVFKPLAEQDSPAGLAAIRDPEMRKVALDLDGARRGQLMKPDGSRMTEAEILAGVHNRTQHDEYARRRDVYRKAFGQELRALVARRDVNPARDVKGPDRGGERSSPYLFPSELLALVTCEAVSHFRRLTYALAVYTYARRGELVALTWEDVSLDSGCILVHRAEDFDTHETKATKTKATRRIPIEPALRPLLEARQGEAGEKVLLRVSHSSELAWMLREDLKRAGVTREELFAKDATRRPIDFHDLRHTGITWRAIRGDDPLKIQRAAGHSDFATTQRYINEAETFDAHAGAPFPPLPLASLASCPAPVSLDRSRAKTPGKVASPARAEQTGPQDFLGNHSGRWGRAHVRYCGAGLAQAAGRTRRPPTGAALRAFRPSPTLPTLREPNFRQTRG